MLTQPGAVDWPGGGRREGLSNSHYLERVDRLAPEARQSCDRSSMFVSMLGCQLSPESQTLACGGNASPTGGYSLFTSVS
ncbi:hypothetical protein RRG08_045557 [Elysia crispata]|uniref:Uncharacterized protein n=1 Tax=Elysia crispata TaxID=231223 RepID=A0AAE1ADN1_9GAST|nr:hypothetical protein RRG08_045557 [Elysia crispata]